MWELQYEAPVGLRTNRNFVHVVVYDMWFDLTDKTWKNDLDDCIGPASSADWKPNTTKAFQRYLNKHSELQGKEVIFANRYYCIDKQNNHVSLDIKATYKE